MPPSPFSADQGDGTYLNPIVPGDWPDPAVVRVGGDYYLTHSSFDYSPGLLLWHSRDLVNWRPLGHALREHDGDVWAPELAVHGGRWSIYYKTTGGIHVVTAEDPAGPWSAPSDVGMHGIDPGHVVDDRGRRLLMVSDGWMTALSDDGLRAVGGKRQVLPPWPIPAGLPIEGVCMEGPKFLRRDGWYHLLTAQGGTAGPATSHMVLHARARDPWGPYEYSPRNPVVRTTSRDQAWWSVGHGTLIDSPDGRWWMLVHGYRRDMRSQGRQTLLLPMRWDADGWLEPSDPATWGQPLPLPARDPSPAGRGLDPSDDFAGPGLGPQWRFWKAVDHGRYQVGLGRLRLAAVGKDLRDSPPLCTAIHHPRYALEVDLERPAPGTEAGLGLFYGPDAHLALAVTHDAVYTRNRWPWGPFPEPYAAGARLRLRLVNDRDEVALSYAVDGGPWTALGHTSEVSGLNHNVFNGFLSLRPCLYACGTGAAVFSRFRYQPLPA